MHHLFVAMSRWREDLDESQRTDWPVPHYAKRIDLVPQGESSVSSSFFLQAEDGIRDHCVTGVQTCALPIWPVNRVVRSSLERIRDFQRAFYAGAPVDGPFWRREREAPTSPALEAKRRAFAARGVYAPMDDESFAAESWQSLLLQLGARPASWPPEADLYDT